ncbi:MAG: hypothetical protein WKF96_13280 [Solirubrobacteraceae bacterium]
MQLMRRLRNDESGAALVTALLCTMVMLALGLALLAIVDTQANESSAEVTRDRAFNLSESVLTSEAFVLGRNWPAAQPSPNPTCNVSSAGFGDTLGSTTPPSIATARLRANLVSSYTDAAYAGATWQVNICDDVNGSTVWDDTLLNNKTWDANLMPDGSTGNGKVWVRAQSTVAGRTRALVGLVKVRETQMLNSKFGLVSGGLTDDLGTSINAVSTGALGGVLGGLLSSTPTVAPDPLVAATVPPSSGVIGLRCGAADINLIPLSTCVAGTIGAAGALPAVSTLLTGGKLEQFPTNTTASLSAINRLRTQAVATNTYYSSSPGGTLASAPACEFTTNTGTRSNSTVVFIEKVGTSGTAGTNFGPGDQYCYLNVGAGLQYKALVIGSGRVIIRGNDTTMLPAATTGPNTFNGVVYALNLQRHAVADGGQGLGDSASPGREVIRIDKGAHVKGGVYADGKSAKVGIYPPPVTINTNALVETLVPCTTVLLVTSCLLQNTVKALGGVTAIVDRLIELVGLTATTNAILDQVRPQRAQYGSAVTADVNAIASLKVYGASGVTPGTFRDLTPR